MPPRGNARSERSAAGRGPSALGAASSGVRVLRGGGSSTTNKGEDAEAGKPEVGRSVVIKESERLGEEERGECQTEKPGEESNAVRAAIKEYDRYKSL